MPKLREREERMIRACDVANNNPDVFAIEQGWDAIDETDRIEEWPGAVKSGGCGWIPRRSARVDHIVLTKSGPH